MNLVELEDTEGIFFSSFIYLFFLLTQITCMHMNDCIDLKTVMIWIDSKNSWDPNPW